MGSKLGNEQLLLMQWSENCVIYAAMLGAGASLFIIKPKS